MIHHFLNTRVSCLADFYLASDCCSEPEENLNIRTFWFSMIDGTSPVWIGTTIEFKVNQVDIWGPTGAGSAGGHRQRGAAQQNPHVPRLRRHGQQNDAHQADIHKSSETSLPNVLYITTGQLTFEKKKSAPWQARCTNTQTHQRNILRRIYSLRASNGPYLISTPTNASCAPQATGTHSEASPLYQICCLPLLEN